MTDTLHDLLHASVADADMPDVADAAWRSGGRARRRRAAATVAGVACVALVVGGLVWAADQEGGAHRVAPVHQPTPSSDPGPAPGGNRPDGSYRGTSVWWAPSVAQESALAYTSSPFPTTIDLSAPESGLTGDPIGRGVAAFAVYGPSGALESGRVLGSDGLLRTVDLTPAGPAANSAPVLPMRDPEGNLRVRAGASMLSPTGEYLMFPQSHSIRVLTLADGRWSTIETGRAETWDATWTEDGRIVLWDPAHPAAGAPVYGVNGRRIADPSATDDLRPRWNADPYGLPRRSPRGFLAQSYTAGPDVPQPPRLHLSPGQSDWIGVAAAPDAILVLPQEASRQKQCCQVAGWLGDDVVFESRSSEGLRILAWQVGTGHFWQVSQVVGWTPGMESVVSSYARLPLPGVDAAS
ncbi:MAG: hypothetical protein QM747_09265 [Nocardioides sp.]